MRLILKDYLIQLKEKDELDLLVCDLLLQKGFVTDNRPETGNRQYGVDIHAHNSKEILLCVVKQGNLERKNWDSGPNAVRQSINEIKDTYIGLINGIKPTKKLRIAVVTNGMMDEAVRPNWEGFVRQNADWNGVKVKIEFWNIDKLVEDVQKHLLDEHLFSGDMRRSLRQALYYIGESDYRNEYFELIIDSYIAHFNDTDKGKVQKKKMAGLYLATQMIAQYAAEAKIYKVAIMVSEYLIIRYWKYLLSHNRFEKTQDVEWLLKFLKSYSKWSQKYYETVCYCCEGPNRLPLYNPVEERVILYDLLGYLTTYAYYLSFLSDYDTVSRERCNQIHSSIINLINNYPQVFYPPYDRHVGTISMLFRFLDRRGRKEDIHQLLQRQCMYSMGYYLKFHKYPTATDSFEDAVNIEIGLLSEDYITSSFWGNMLEWIVLMGQDDLYQQLQVFLDVDLKEVTKCTWFLRADEETLFYDPYAMTKAGEGIAINVERSFEQLAEKTHFIMEQYKNEMFSYEKYCFKALEFIVSRYYGYLVKVQKEEN